MHTNNHTYTHQGMAYSHAHTRTHTLRLRDKMPEPICTIFGRVQRRFVVAIQLLEYFCDRIFESYSSNESQP